MGSKLDYSAITTKIRAMNNNLLSQEQYVEIAGLSTISELISYLKSNTSYATLLSSLNENDVHRGQLEKIISNSLYSDFTKLYKFANATQKQFLHLYFLRYEVAIVKECLCAIYDSNEPIDLSHFYDFFKSHSKIDVIQLATARDATELIEYLKDSRLYKVLSNVHQYADPGLLDYEMHLDLFYFQEIWRSRKKFLTGEDLAAITEVYGKKIDLLNLQWILRAKKHFNLASHEIYTLIIPIQYKLKQYEFNSMVDADSLETLSQLISSSFYGKQMGLLNANTVEDTYLKLQHVLNNKSSRLHPYSVAIINSYLYNKERERNRLITATECIRYGMDFDTILAYITK